MVDVRGRRIYLDANTIIYAVQSIPGFSNLKRGLLRPLDEGLVNVVTSELSLAETLVLPRKEGQAQLEILFRDFLAPRKNLQVLPVSLTVIEKLIDLWAAFGVKTPDAIHLATGILSNCDLFVTADKGWIKTGVNIVDPSLLGY